ncbi:MAG: hypothetical protein ABI723_01725 [Bacteroidia bacterium]
MKNLLIILFMLLSTAILNAQNLSAYIAYNDNLNVFDEGTFSKPELTKVTKLFVGYNYIAYVSFDNKLKFYWRKNLNDINEAAFLDKAMPSKYLFAYLMGKQLKVIDKGKDRTLSNWCEKVVTTDSLVGYYDDNKSQHFIYYNGDTYALDDVLNRTSDLLNNDNAAIGNNTFLYVNSFQKLKVMYRGEFYELIDYTPEVKFKAGTDICVYNNFDLTAFKAYCNGLEYTIETTIPQSYKLGNGMVAYVDGVNQFKVFYNNKKINLLSTVPANYEVVDSIIQYNDNVNNWYVFYAGKSYQLLNYVPRLMKISQGTVAYIDNLGRLMVFQNGASKIISQEIVTSFEVNGNVVTYTLGEHDVKVYWNGTTY